MPLAALIGLAVAGDAAVVRATVLVAAARAVPDPDGALIRARVEVEQAALAVDDHLVALHGLAERERAGRMGEAAAAVASVEEAAAALADVASASRATVLPAVAEALERARLVAEARAELDAADPTAAWPTAGTGEEAPAAEEGGAQADAADEDEGPGEPGESRGQPRPTPG